MFSKACEYGIKAMIFIAQQSEMGQRVSLKAIAKAIESPEAFTAKILQALTRSGFLISTKGPSGGFVLAYPASTMNLAQIVTAIDGDKIFNGCGLGLEECDSNRPCPIHHRFAIVRNELRDMLEQSSLAELSEGLVQGVAFLKR